MDKIAKAEYGVILIVLGCLAVSLLPALQYSRREYRDGTRRDALATLKQQLEEKNNQLGFYPVKFDASPYSYTVTKSNGPAAIGWYLRATLENWAKPMSGFDYESGRNYYFRIVGENHQTYYDVCGGEATCGAPKAIP